MSDVHLGSLLSVEGLDARPELKDLYYQATYTAFENICRLAEESEASFVPLSGDVMIRKPGLYAPIVSLWTL